MRQACYFKFILGASLWLAAGPTALAKGLDDLSDANPEAKAEDGEAAAKGAASAAPQPAGAMSKALAEKLYASTSFGFVKASKGSGEWSSNGMSDVTFGYRIMSLGGGLSVAGTYRYAPIAVTGNEDGQEYSGSWEGHYFGGQVHYPISSNLRALGSGELGYVLVHLQSEDDQTVQDKHQAAGVSVAVGGGADYTLSEGPGFAVGPRLYAGLGSFTTIQLAAAFSFLF